MTTYVIESAKLVAYLLNPDHPKGGPKCRLFMRYGFTLASPDRLAAALTEHMTVNREGSELMPDAYTSKRIVRGPLTTPSGARPYAVSVWQILPGGRERLITAYIREA